METKLLSSKEEDLRFAAEIIKNGGLVGVPTETVYGLGANALDKKAVKKIFEAKGRPSDNPLIVHINDISQWSELVEEIPENALRLAEKYWPGPLTIILKKKDIIPMETSGNLDTVAVRIPDSEITRELIFLSGVPIAAPSANTSGMPSPTTANHVIHDLDGKIEAVIDGGECRVGVESTVITLAADKPRLLRPGGITPRMLEEVLGEIEIDKAVYNKLDDTEKASSPGMKYKHYSPKAKVVILKGDFDKYNKYIEENKTENTVALCFDGEERMLKVKSISYGKSTDSFSQAKNIFSALRKLDDMGADVVYVRYPDRSGMGLAVYNRLIRAAAFEVIEL